MSVILMDVCMLGSANRFRSFSAFFKESERRPKTAREFFEGPKGEWVEHHTMT